MKCVICDSNATSLHFGTASCKACAAFFRRTVALDINYKCVLGDNNCDINYERRMSCKRCRYDKCIKNKMQRELVQSRKGKSDNIEDFIERESKSHSPEINTSIPTTSFYFHDLADNSRRLASHIANMDSNLNKGRRMAFTDSRLLDIFSGICEMPYEKQQLRQFDFRSYKGYEKHEYVIMFNYANSLPDFHLLSNSDQNFLFRIACGVDLLISCAYYTQKIGLDNNLLINHDGTYIPMLPLPLLNDEPGSSSLFPGKDDFEKYKNLIKPKVKLWQDYVPKFIRMDFSFHENALLKALATWQLSQFNFDDKGRDICRRQKIEITKSLLRICQNIYGQDEGALRAGNIVLFVSMIHDELMELVSTLIIISFFDIMEGDPLINEMLTTRSLFA